MAKIDLSLISSTVFFTFTSLGSKDFIIELISLISCIPGGIAYPIVDPEIYFLSKVSTISS